MRNRAGVKVAARYCMLALRLGAIFERGRTGRHDAGSRDDDRIMWRCLAIAAVLYGFGHPEFEAYRPVAFERSLREFHRDVNRIAAVSTRGFVMFDQNRALRSLNSLGAQFQSMLSGR
jgi:hypothetical protein